MTATTLTPPDLLPFLPDLNAGKAAVVVAEVLEAAQQSDNGAYSGIFAVDFEWPQTAAGILRDAAIRRYNLTPPGQVDPDQALGSMFNSAELSRLRELLSSRSLWAGAAPLGSFPDACPPSRW